MNLSQISSASETIISKLKPASNMSRFLRGEEDARMMFSIFNNDGMKKAKIKTYQHAYQKKNKRGSDVLQAYQK